MFGFGKTSRDPLADVKSTERWLASFPATDPLAIHGEVVAELGRAAEPTARRSPQRLEAVFFLDAHCTGAAQEPDRRSTSSMRRAARRSSTSCGRRCST